MNTPKRLIGTPFSIQHDTLLSAVKTVMRDVPEECSVTGFNTQLHQTHCEISVYYVGSDTITRRIEYVLTSDWLDYREEAPNA